MRSSMRHGTDLDGYRRGCLAFVREFHDCMGVVLDDQAKPTFAIHESTGRMHKLPNSARPEEVSLRQLAEAVHGYDFVEEFYNPNNGFDFGSRQLVESAVDPTAFLNINTFNLAVAGLVNAKIIEAFTNPAYIGIGLVHVEPTTMNGQKMIGVGRMTPPTKAAMGRKPGERHAEVGMTEMYQTTPETVEDALKVSVTKEATFFDLTGDVLRRANEVGDSPAYQREKDIADMFLGVSSGYNFNGTSYNTYQTASPFINDHSNPFSDQNDIDEARQLFVGMTDPITGREIQVTGINILCMPARELKFRESLFGTNVQIGTQLNSNFPSRWTQTGNMINQVGGGTYTLTPLTAIWYNRATAADGLNLSASNAKEYWWVGDYPKAFYWMQNWDLQTWQASADELTMKDQGLVAVYGANHRGIGWPKEPRYVVRNKN